MASVAGVLGTKQDLSAPPTLAYYHFFLLMPLENVVITQVPGTAWQDSPPDQLSELCVILSAAVKAAGTLGPKRLHWALPSFSHPFTHSGSSFPLGLPE